MERSYFKGTRERFAEGENSQSQTLRSDTRSTQSIYPLLAFSVWPKDSEAFSVQLVTRLDFFLPPTDFSSKSFTQFPVGAFSCHAPGFFISLIAVYPAFNRLDRILR